MSKHTLGPWVVTRVSKSTILKDIYVSAGSERIARVVVPATASSIDEYEANARLIAAAPDLLEALRELEEAARCVQAGEWDRSSIDVERRKARAAIAKATGSQA